MSEQQPESRDLHHWEVTEMCFHFTYLHFQLFIISKRDVHTIFFCCGNILHNQGFVPSPFPAAVSAFVHYDISDYVQCALFHPTCFY